MDDELKQRRDALAAGLEAMRVERQRNEPKPDRPPLPYIEPQYDPAFDTPVRLTPTERAAAIIIMIAFSLFLAWLGPGR